MGNGKKNEIKMPPKPRGKLVDVWVCEWCGGTAVSFSDDTWLPLTTCGCQGPASNVYIEMKNIYHNEKFKSAP